MIREFPWMQPLPNDRSHKRLFGKLWRSSCPCNLRALVALCGKFRTISMRLSRKSAVKRRAEHQPQWATRRAAGGRYCYALRNAQERVLPEHGMRDTDTNASRARTRLKRSVWSTHRQVLLDFTRRRRARLADTRCLGHGGVAPCSVDVLALAEAGDKLVRIVVSLDRGWWCQHRVELHSNRVSGPLALRAATHEKDQTSHSKS